MRKVLIWILGLALAAGGALYVVAFRTPTYHAFLVFGRGSGPRVHLRARGKAISVELQGSDHVAGAAHHFTSFQDCKGLAYLSSDGKTQYVLHEIVDILAPPRKAFNVIVDIDGPTGRRREGRDFVPTSDPEVAPTIQFDAPLMISGRRMTCKPSDLNLELNCRIPLGIDPLRRGKTPNMLYAQIYGIPERAAVLESVVCTEDLDTPERRRLVPDAVQPWVEIEFPARMPGQPPIRKQFRLDGIC